MQLAFQQSGTEFSPIGDEVVRRARSKATTWVSGSAKLSGRPAAQADGIELAP